MSALVLPLADETQAARRLVDRVRRVALSLSALCSWDPADVWDSVPSGFYRLRRESPRTRDASSLRSFQHQGCEEAAPPSKGGIPESPGEVLCQGSATLSPCDIGAAFNLELAVKIDCQSRDDLAASLEAGNLEAGTLQARDSNKQGTSSGGAGAGEPLLAACSWQGQQSSACLHSAYSSAPAVVCFSRFPLPLPVAPPIFPALQTRLVQAHSFHPHSLGPGTRINDPVGDDKGGEQNGENNTAAELPSHTAEWGPEGCLEGNAAAPEAEAVVSGATGLGASSLAWAVAELEGWYPGDGSCSWSQGTAAALRSAWAGLGGFPGRCPCCATQQQQQQQRQQQQQQQEIGSLQCSSRAPLGNPAACNARSSSGHALCQVIGRVVKAQRPPHCSNASAATQGPGPGPGCPREMEPLLHLWVMLVLDEAAGAAGQQAPAGVAKDDQHCSPSPASALKGPPAQPSRDSARERVACPGTQAVALWFCRLVTGAVPGDGMRDWALELLLGSLTACLEALSPLGGRGRGVGAWAQTRKGKGPKMNLNGAGGPVRGSGRDGLNGEIEGEDAADVGSAAEQDDPVCACPVAEWEAARDLHSPTHESNPVTDPQASKQGDRPVGNVPRLPPGWSVGGASRGLGTGQLEGNGEGGGGRDWRPWGDGGVWSAAGEAAAVALWRQHSGGGRNVAGFQSGALSVQGAAWYDSVGAKAQEERATRQYQAVIAHDSLGTRPVRKEWGAGEVPLDRSNSRGQDNNEQAEEGHEIKRRRTRYKMQGGKPTPREALRGIIEAHMAEIAAQGEPLQRQGSLSDAFQGEDIEDKDYSVGWWHRGSKETKNKGNYGRVPESSQRSSRSPPKYISCKEEEMGSIEPHCAQDSKQRADSGSGDRGENIFSKHGADESGHRSRDKASHRDASGVRGRVDDVEGRHSLSHGAGRDQGEGIHPWKDQRSPRKSEHGEQGDGSENKGIMSFRRREEHRMMQRWSATERYQGSGPSEKGGELSRDQVDERQEFRQSNRKQERSLRTRQEAPEREGEDGDRGRTDGGRREKKVRSSKRRRSRSRSPTGGRSYHREGSDRPHRRIGYSLESRSGGRDYGSSDGGREERRSGNNHVSAREAEDGGRWEDTWQ